MLYSNTQVHEQSPRPTRAKAIYIVSVVLNGIECVMLKGETAVCQNLCFIGRVYKIGGAFQENGNGINAFEPFREFVLPSVQTDN